MVLTEDEPLDSLPEAEGIIGDGETSDLGHLGSPPSPDCGFKSDRSLISMASSISSHSDRSDGSRCSRRGRRHQEETCMKINLPIFKDEDAKDMVTYQS